MGGLRIDSGPILTHMRASLSWIVETVAPEIQQHVSCLGRPAAAPEGGETQQKGNCMPKRTAKFDMQRSNRGNIQTINGCICRKRRSNLTCGARFTQTNALGSQLNGSVHLDPAGIILDGGIKPVGWSFDSPMHRRHRRKIRRSSST